MEESRQMLTATSRAMSDVIDAGIIAPDMPPAQAVDLMIAVFHGLTVMHMANEPDLPLGSGR